MALRYAIDTNVLLRLSHKDHPQQELIASALRRLVARRVDLCFAPQNLGEFWNVSTRPLERNGLGLSIRETDAHIESIERRMTVLEEDRRVYLTWRRPWCRITCVVSRFTMPTLRQFSKRMM